MLLFILRKRTVIVIVIKALKLVEDVEEEAVRSFLAVLLNVVVLRRSLV